MADTSEDEDFLIYALLGAAIVYFLYKNNVFGAPAAAGSGGGSIIAPPKALPSPTPVAAPVNSDSGGNDFGINPSGGWDG